MVFLKFYFLAAVAVPATLAQSASTNSSKVSVAVYYEALCPDSMAFFTKQLEPTMTSALKSNIDLKLVPFGKANMTKVENDVTFECSHGAEECHRDKIQACVLRSSKLENVDDDHQKTIIYCLMQTDKKSLQDCVKNAKVDTANVQVIEQCANSTEGDSFLEEMANTTRKDLDGKTPESVPLVTINGEKNQNAIKDLTTVVCSKFNSSQISECKNSKNGATSYQLSAPFFAILIAAALVRL